MATSPMKAHSNIRQRLLSAPMLTGVVAGLIAIALEGYFTVGPPSTYGLCVACHGRDLANSGANFVAGSELPVAGVSLTFPVLTVVGIVLGALVASLIHGEFRLQLPDGIVRNFIWGFLVMNFALLAAGCSFRLLLRTARGDTLGLLGFGAMVAGIAITSIVLRWRVTR